MKLINDFFQLIEINGKPNGFSAFIELNAEHIVYSAHFPGQPITPGVIQMQIVHELLENHIGNKLKLISIPQCKFLKILNPSLVSKIIVHIEFDKTEALINAKAWGENGNDIYFRLNSKYELNN